MFRAGLSRNSGHITLQNRDFLGRAVLDPLEKTSATAGRVI